MHDVTEEGVPFHDLTGEVRRGRGSGGEGEGSEGDAAKEVGGRGAECARGNEIDGERESARARE